MRRASIPRLDTEDDQEPLYVLIEMAPLEAYFEQEYKHRPFT